MHAILDMAHTGADVAPDLESALGRVEQCFVRQATSPSAPTAELCRHVEHYRGKMLRPVLVMLSGLASSPRDRVGQSHSPISDDLITVATVIEMIHMATLVHDDVLDQAQTRRGADTVNARYGLEAAVTLGDFLFARSFHLCSTLESQRTALRIGEVTAAVCEGEILQNSWAGRFDLPEATYMEIIERKTAALIGVACELGAAHADADLDTRRRLHDFGLKVGIAFQIQDDLLDLIGDEQVVGKTLGRDLEAGKLTLPLIHHLTALADSSRRMMIDRLREQAVSSVVGHLESTSSIAYARGVAASLVAEAKALLAPLQESPAKDSLRDLATAVVTREF